MGMKKKDRKKICMEDLRHATKNGLKGAAQDAFLESKSWGFNLEDIHVPTFLWHGKKDDVVPYRIAEYLSAHLGNCKHFESIDTENHSMIRRHWVTMLKQLISNSTSTSTSTSTINRKY